MEAHLSKWNPFKFLRKSPDEKRAEPAQATGTAATANLPAAWFVPPRFLVGDPFHLLFDPVGTFGAFERWFGDFSPSVFEPRIDVVDDDDAIQVTAELPGMERQDLQVLIEDGALVVRGEKKLESSGNEKGCYRVERAFGRFERVVPLPDSVDLERAEASFDKGVLKVRVPKSDAKERSGARQLEIK
jgi:HSP20 family protein